MKKGDYVLATKYADGDPSDHWAVGFYDHHDPVKDRHYVTNDDGVQFRANGFRRVEKVSGERGAWILKHSKEIAYSDLSLWHFATCSME